MKLEPELFETIYFITFLGGIFGKLLMLLLSIDIGLIECFGYAFVGSSFGVVVESVFRERFLARGKKGSLGDEK